MSGDGDRRERIADLIERSSLGTPEAKALRELVPPEMGRRIALMAEHPELVAAVREAYTPEGQAIFWDGYEKADAAGRSRMAAGVLQEWSGQS